MGSQNETLVRAAVKQATAVTYLANVGTVGGMRPNSQTETLVTPSPGVVVYDRSPGCVNSCVSKLPT